MKQLSQLIRLSRIDSLIRDPKFTATQVSIARELNVSDRTIRNDFDILTALGAPLILEGRWNTGWIYEAADWDFWTALKEYVENKK